MVEDKDAIRDERAKREEVDGFNDVIIQSFMAARKIILVLCLKTTWSCSS